ncbi:uncharacterized protein HMPREF1541_06585 [Cyphellophora europaea CBS 101466]|uniref:Major facilitator superfamily (MFS) profile domain-containing protein n=1 Tax=Cyphellophora europaea (strain CBS 101466) TaxID=1220924 RepID=W2RS61_CYPE1|nr:uncharacterized protein HMPREF1541_06585 [Cyphellophora europaea CBS 101466]ETN38549.1 hypothetical protein HMPREF1541_06585 [Cyphellophora europaea CBS 101466]
MVTCRDTTATAFVAATLPTRAALAAMPAPPPPPPPFNIEKDTMTTPSTTPHSPAPTGVNTAATTLLPDHLNPRHWPPHIKHLTALLTSLSQLITLMTASILAPALPRISASLRLSASTALLTLSIYLLGLGLGPLVLAPLSEVYGRRPLWLYSQIFFIVWNSLCPVGASRVLMVVGRFLAGVGASGGGVLAGPIMSDIYGKEERGRALGLAMLFPYLGPAVGPIVGGVVGERVGWPWLFWVVSLADAVVVGVGWWGLRESYAPVITMGEERRRARAEGSGEGVDGVGFVGTVGVLRVSVMRPLVLLWTRPALQVISFLYGLDFGLYTIVLSTFATLWIERYHQSETESSLHYIAIAMGSTIASQGGGFLTDIIWRRLSARKGKGNEVPEFRMPMLAISSVIMPLGLIWYGWAAERRDHWLVVDAGVVMFCLGCFAMSQAQLAYLLDEFVEHAASANAGARVLSFTRAWDMDGATRCLR